MVLLQEAPRYCWLLLYQRPENFAKAGLKVGYQLLKFVGRVQKKKFVGEVSS